MARRRSSIPPPSRKACAARNITPLAGQAQKEFFVNQGFAQLDLLLHPSVKGERANPPDAPAAGDCWLVAGAPTGNWTGKEYSISCWDGFQWLFAKPKVGMIVHDHSISAFLHFDGQWRRIAQPANPTGGTVIDTQARAAIAAILDALDQFGVFSAN